MNNGDTMTTIFQRWRTTDSSQLTNGSSKYTPQDGEKPARSWWKIRVTEWTFSVSLFLFSLSIVLGKLCTNYGNASQGTGDRHSSSVTTFARIYDTIHVPSLLTKFDVLELSANSEKLLNASNQYAGAAADALVTFYGKYGWLMKAMMSGLVITSFTWFIVYKDSSIPGINPPSPFSPSRRRAREGTRMQMNYLVGVLNGILFFVYMCL